MFSPQREQTNSRCVLKREMFGSSRLSSVWKETDMKFGVFDHVDSTGTDLGTHLENRLKIAEAYDRCGIHGYHVAEHHGTPLGLAPSPSVFLSAVIQRTKRLRIGPLIFLLPLYHPLRLIE